MRKYTATIFVLAALLISGLFFGIFRFLFPARNHIQADVVEAAHVLRSSDDNGDDNGDDQGTGLVGDVPSNLLGTDDAAFLRYAAAARQATSAPDGYRPRYADDELTRRLIAEAERRKLAPEGRPEGAAWEPALSSLRPLPPENTSTQERRAFLQMLEAGIHEVSERVAIALADRAVLKQVEAEAELRVIHTDLTGLADKRLIPTDPLYLVPPDLLERAVDAVRPHERALAERQSIHDTADTRAALAHVRSRLSRYQAIRSNQSYAEFHANGSGFKALAREIPQSKWAALRADSANRVLAEANRLKLEAASIPGQEEIIRFIHQQRGPPSDSPAARLFDAVRYFDLDVGTAVRSAARLDAALSQLDRDLPESHPIRSLGVRQRLLSVLGDADFYEFKRLVTFGQKNGGVPSPLSAERALYMKNWADAVAEEAIRRRAADIRLTRP